MDVHHTAVWVSDLETTVEFYEDGFGWTTHGISSTGAASRATS